MLSKLSETIEQQFKSAPRDMCIKVMVTVMVMVMVMMTVMVMVMVVVMDEDVVDAPTTRAERVRVSVWQAQPANDEIADTPG